MLSPAQLKPVPFVLLLLCPGTNKVLGSLGDYRIKYAAARAKQHPDMAAVYEAKIAAMKKAGGQIQIASPYSRLLQASGCEVPWFCSPTPAARVTWCATT
jgi:hypothetical protein